MRDHIFRKYDIRGIVGQELPLTDVYHFGRAVAYYFIRRNPDIQRIVIGMDGRTHSPEIRQELIRALIDSGLDVSILGVCPTPVFYFALQTLSVDAGIMITASHNPPEYNGFKIAFGKDLISAHEITTLRDLYKRKARSERGRVGLTTKMAIIPHYMSWLEQAFAHLKGSDINAVVDCGSGAAATVMPELVQRMAWQNVTLLYDTVDGTFPHRCPDPTQPGASQELARVVALQKASCGVAFDGDADRMIALTEDGALVTGDRMLLLFSQEVLKANPGATVVFDAKCTQVLPAFLQKWGATYYRTPTGHSFVKQKMIETDALLAGELSNHFMFKDRYFGYDDGIYAMMRLFEIVQTTGETLYELLSVFPTSYTTGEVRIPCDEKCKDAIVQSVHAAFIGRTDAMITTMDGVCVEMPYGWGIVRASNTEPVMSFSCESMTKEGFEKIKDDFYQALAPAFHDNILYRTKAFDELGCR